MRRQIMWSLSAEAKLGKINGQGDIGEGFKECNWSGCCRNIPVVYYIYGILASAAALSVLKIFSTCRKYSVNVGDSREKCLS